MNANLLPLWCAQLWETKRTKYIRKVINIVIRFMFIQKHYQGMKWLPKGIPNGPKREHILTGSSLRYKLKKKILVVGVVIWIGDPWINPNNSVFLILPHWAATLYHTERAAPKLSAGCSVWVLNILAPSPTVEKPPKDLGKKKMSSAFIKTPNKNS